MEIINAQFEKSLKIVVKGEEVELLFFKTTEHGNVKVGVNAPRNVSVNREEIYQKKKEKIKTELAFYEEQNTRGILNKFRKPRDEIKASISKRD